MYNSKTGKIIKDYEIKYLEEIVDVAVLPRTEFKSKNEREKDEYIRLSYATSKENIIEGLKRIKNAIERRK